MLQRKIDMSCIVTYTGKHDGLEVSVSVSGPRGGGGGGGGLKFKRN